MRKAFSKATTWLQVTNGKDRFGHDPEPLQRRLLSPDARTRPAVSHRCGTLPPIRRSDGVHRARTIPWTQARATRRRQVSWLAGHCVTHGLPRLDGLERPAQWLPPQREAICIALTAYSCRDSLGLRRQAVRTTFPIKSLSGHRRDHCRQSSHPGRGRTTPKATSGHSQASMFSRAVFGSSKRIQLRE